MKYYKFFFHYNKPLSKKLGKPQLSIHYRNTCHIVDKIHCAVTIESKNNKKQPFCVMTGKCKCITIDNTSGEKWGIIQ